LVIKIKDYVTRDRGLLMDTLNKAPKPESMIQNQLLLLEVLCDVRKCLVELLFRTEWLKKAAPMKKQDEKRLSMDQRVKIISKRAMEKNASDEDVEAF
jgi:hypothetical protein